MKYRSKETDGSSTIIDAYEKPSDAQKSNSLLTYVGNLIIVTAPPELDDMSAGKYYDGVSKAIKQRQPEDTSYSFSFHPDDKLSGKRFRTIGNRIVGELSGNADQMMDGSASGEGMLVAMPFRPAFGHGVDQVILRKSIEWTFSGRQDTDLTHIALVGIKGLVSLGLEASEVGGGDSFMLSRNNPDGSLVWEKIYSDK
jgi:hypothetical protein